MKNTIGCSKSTFMGSFRSCIAEECGLHAINKNNHCQGNNAVHIRDDTIAFYGEVLRMDGHQKVIDESSYYSQQAINGSLTH